MVLADVLMRATDSVLPLCLLGSKVKHLCDRNYAQESIKSSDFFDISLGGRRHCRVFTARCGRLQLGFSIQPHYLVLRISPRH